MPSTLNVRLGTRASALALYQANQVRALLQKEGVLVKLVEIRSKGDSDTDTPLNRFGQTGIFTAALDDALLAGEIDVAVHSLKDYPTVAPDGLCIAGWLPRANPYDKLILRSAFDPERLQGATLRIATGSARRKAQWLSKYPHHRVVGLRGNVPTRLDKITLGETCDGGILASAGLDRLGLKPQNSFELHWMVPAPAQGVIGMTCREDDIFAQLLERISDTDSMVSSHIERTFLRTLEGGCSAPIGALALKTEDGWRFKGCLVSVDGRRVAETSGLIAQPDWRTAGQELARRCLDSGGKEIMETIRND